MFISILQIFNFLIYQNKEKKNKFISFPSIYWSPVKYQALGYIIGKSATHQISFISIILIPVRTNAYYIAEKHSNHVSHLKKINRTLKKYSLKYFYEGEFTL